MRTKYKTTTLNDVQAMALDEIPVVTWCYECTGDEEKNSPHIHVSKNQPYIGIICGCGERCCASKIDKHLHVCEIAKCLKAGENPLVRSLEIGPDKMASVDLKEYGDLLDPKFMFTRDGSLLVRYHHKHCWVCTGCGHRSETWKTLVNAHINAKVKDSKGKVKDPVEMCCPTPKEWPMLQPNLDTCAKVKYVKVACNYVKEEASKKKKPAKTNTTPTTKITAAVVSTGKVTPVTAKATATTLNKSKNNLLVVARSKKSASEKAGRKIHTVTSTVPPTGGINTRSKRSGTEPGNKPEMRRRSKRGRK